MCIFIYGLDIQFDLFSLYYNVIILFFNNTFGHFKSNFY